MWPPGCHRARYCGAATGRVLGAITWLYPTKTGEVPNEAKSTGGAMAGSDDTGDATKEFHAVELAGFDQDTLPIIVTNATGEPVTLLAGIDLNLTENYISSGMLTALGLSSPRVVNIAKPDQKAAALGAEALKVTPYAKVSLDFLTGAQAVLKHFTDVEFDVFELSSYPEGHVVWQPDVYLGVAFLTDALALRLADGFAGSPAIEGLPVLVRSLEGYQVGEGAKQDTQEGWEKDEL
jgi:hypothetical protein